MASNILQFPRVAANENPEPPIIPPFNPANPAHIRAWRTMYLLGREELKRRMNGERY